MDEGNIVDGQSYQGPSSSNHKFRMRPVTIVSPPPQQHLGSIDTDLESAEIWI